MYTNHPSYGGLLLDSLLVNLAGSSNVIVAAGYVSIETIKRFEPEFYRIAKTGSIKLLVGMAFYEGLTSGSLTLLRQIDVNK